MAFMIDLLDDGRSGQLLHDHATEGQERPIAIGLAKGLPEPGEGDARAFLQRARGGTGRDVVCRTMIPCVETVPGGAGSNRPASGGPDPRLWGGARRIDK